MPKESQKSISPRETPYSGKKSEKREELKCPICLDHPHNAVSLICSSVKCKPFMCHTTDLLSNCFEEFCRRGSVIPSDGKFDGPAGCPLCRGVITGCNVDETARKSMDKMARNCSINWCEFFGSHDELMKHAEKEHPGSRPRDEEEVEEEDDDVDEDDDEESDDDSYEIDDDEEDELEWTAVSSKEGTFEDQIHFGRPGDAVLKDEVSVSANGKVTLQRTMVSGTIITYGGADMADIDRIRAM